MLRPCLQPRCGALVSKGTQYCATHQRAVHERDIQHRGTARARGYDQAWAVLAAAYKRTHPHCEWHLSNGEQVITEIIDHRVALRDGGPRLDPRNLQALCRSCHARKTHAEGRQHRIARDAPISFKGGGRKTARESTSSAPTFPGELRGEFFV